MNRSFPAASRQGRALLWVADQVSSTRYVVDTGAAISIVPSSLDSPQERLVYDLLAANGNPIATYGTKAFHLTLAPDAVFT